MSGTSLIAPSLEHESTDVQGANLMLAPGSPPTLSQEGVSRRDFLRFGGAGVLGLSAAEQRARADAAGQGRRRCIFLLLNGGASGFETFDPKPGARGDLRGPYKAIATATPGMLLSETLPHLAQRSGKFSLIRSLTHDAAPIHETALQYLQTGRLVQGNVVPPSLGSIVASTLGPRSDWPAYAVLPRMLRDDVSTIWQGQGAGSLGPDLDPWQPLDCPGGDAPAEAVDSIYATVGRAWRDDSDPHRRAYGDSPLARSCLAALRLAEHGVRFVTINMFNTLAERVTWDCHANGTWAPAAISDYRSTLCPDLDRALSALLDDLEQRGMLQETLVVVTGEFGRTPRINDRGGRDHWTGVWPALLAGGGIAGGRVLGASDARGAYPAERPVAPAELAATILQSLGVDLATRLPLSDGSDLAPADAPPLAELVA